MGDVKPTCNECVFHFRDGFMVGVRHCPACASKDADAELGRMVRELVKHRGFATLACRPYDGRWLVVFDFDPAKPFEGDTIDEAVKRAQERGT